MSKTQAECERCEGRGWVMYGAINGPGAKDCPDCTPAAQVTADAELDSPTFTSPEADALKARGFQRVNRHTTPPPSAPKCATSDGLYIHGSHNRIVGDRWVCEFCRQPIDVCCTTPPARGKTEKVSGDAPSGVNSTTTSSRAVGPVDPGASPSPATGEEDTPAIAVSIHPDTGHLTMVVAGQRIDCDETDVHDISRALRGYVKAERSRARREALEEAAAFVHKGDVAASDRQTLCERLAKGVCALAAGEDEGVGRG